MLKKYLALVLLVIILLLIGNNFYQTRKYKAVNYSNTLPAEVLEKNPEQRMLAVVDIGGFDCPSCPIIAENALKDTKGVLDARTTSTGKASRVLYDASVISLESIQKVLSPAGYTVDKIITNQPTQINKLD
ncbi:MAG: hypothetical protein M1405_01690, partial [Patescibacteria group bacterium]|nr:hypothetical protein [Patescibacteria group bacterium]